MLSRISSFLNHDKLTMILSMVSLYDQSMYDLFCFVYSICISKQFQQ